MAAVVGLDDTASHFEFEEINAIRTEPLRLEQYTEVLASYLLQNDLCNGKFLWKRVPLEMKTNEELAAVWRVGQKLWAKDMPGFYAEVQAFPWGPSVAPIMTQLIEFQREKNIRLIGIAYTSIRVEDIAKLLGVTLEEAENLAAARGWAKVDGMILPQEPSADPIKLVSAEEQLGKLTDFVTFLEN